MTDKAIMHQFTEAFVHDFGGMDNQPLIFRETEPARPYLVLAAFEDTFNHVGCAYKWWVLGVMDKVRDMTPGGGSGLHPVGPDTAGQGQYARDLLPAGPQSTRMHHHP